MNTIGWMASLAVRPDIITEPGQYRTRAGETVTIHTVSTRQDFGCFGRYDGCGVAERWHKCGAIFHSIQSANDILGRA